jgi:heme exporter protein A
MLQAHNLFQTNNLLQTNDLLQTNNLLQTSNLTGIRGGRVLFESLALTIQSGELVQVEGRNGSGKTTLLRILAGLGDKESGEITWNGQSIDGCRDLYHQDLLFIGHQTGVKRELTAFENLHFYQKIHGMDADESALYFALAQVGLAGREDIPVAKLSAGQQRRVALARLWLSQHKLWILDEPLTAIDKQGVAILAELFVQHCQSGGIVIVTTHQDLLVNRHQYRTITLGER